MAKLDSDARTNSNSAPVAVWPRVCRLQNGRYVEASRDFPTYYDNTILPSLDNAISEMRQTVAEQQRVPKPTPGSKYGTQAQIDVTWREPERGLATYTMIRDKVLRVLGRDSNAGLAEAREWMKSSDPELVQDAVVVLRDMGGHPQDLAGAKAALIRLEPYQADLQDFIDKQKP
ncbi:MAG: hypothetical protein ABSD31_04900 [Candidatus Binataceae bacterium]|jgi:hypothetical protein